MIVRIVSVLIALCCATSLHAQTPAAAEKPAPARAGFEHVLPAGTVAFVGVSDVDALAHDFHASAWGQLLADPACDALRSGVEQQWAQAGEALQEQLGFDALPLLGMLHGPVALALTHLPVVTEESTNDALGMEMVLLADFGDDLDQAQALVEQLLDLAVDRTHAARSTDTVGEVEITVIHDEDPEAEVPAMRAAFHGSVLAICVGPAESDATMTTMLEALDGEDADTLADVPAFRGSMASQPGGVVAWADLAKVVHFSLDVMRVNEQRWAGEGEVIEDASSPIPGLTMTAFYEKLGLLSVGAMSMHTTWDARGAEGRVRIEASGQGWLPRLMRTLFGPTATGHPASVTVDCQSMTAWHLDLPGLFDLVMKVMLDSGAFAPDELAAGLAEMEEGLGFDLREDLLALFDGQITAIIDETEADDALPGTEASPMNVALLLGVSDGPQLNSLLEDVIRSRGLHAGRKMVEFQGQQIFTVNVTPFSLNYCVLPDALVLSLSGTMLQDVLRLRGSPDLPNLSSDPKYAAALKTVGAHPGVLMYGDAASSTVRSFEAYATAMQALNSVIGESEAGTPVRSLLEFLTTVPMPDRATVEKYIHGGSISTLTADETGLLLESHGP